jgi:serine protease Do
MQKPKTLMWILVTLTAGVGLGLIIASQLDFATSGIAKETVAFRAGSFSNLPPSSLDLAATSKAYVQVAKQVMPTVVSITSETVVKFHHPLTDFFHQDWFRGRTRERGEEEFRQEGLGSGVIISADGYILTNNHVIREAEAITVWIDKKQYKAEIVGADPKTDLAVIRIKEKNLPVAQLGNSDELEVGELVMAVGNPFFRELAHSVTAGIVSGKGRTHVGVGDIDYEDFIQTDAAINPGNSGGALVNLRGEVVGINTAIVSSGWGGGNVGIGFAIPINLVRQITEQLITTGKVVRGWMGVYIQGADQELMEAMKLPSVDGALITKVSPDSPASKAGLRERDFIIEVENVQIRDHNHLMNMIATFKPNTRVFVKFIRDGRELSTYILLSERPNSPQEIEEKRPSELTLGMKLENLTEDLAAEYDLGDASGIVVTRVEPGSQAKKEGIRAGDVISEVNRQPISSVGEFRRIIFQTKPGDMLLLRIARQSGNFFVALKAGND